MPEVRNTVRMLAEKIAKDGSIRACEVFCEFCIIIRSNENCLEKVLKAVGVERKYVFPIKKWIIMNSMFSP